MKTALRALALVFTTVMVYLLGAFCAWDFNPGNWPTDGRAIAALMAALLLPISIGFYLAL